MCSSPVTYVVIKQDTLFFVAFRTKCVAQVGKQVYVCVLLRFLISSPNEILMQIAQLVSGSAAQQRCYWSWERVERVERMVQIVLHKSSWPSLLF